MPQPIAICIENCYPPHESLRYLRCVAVHGLGRGLSILPGGEVAWNSEAPSQAQIWVSGDGRLIFFRPEGAPDWAQVHRGGRSVDVPDGKPVVLLDGDYLVVPGFCFRLHVHGPAGVLHEPAYLDHAEPAGQTRSRLAAAGAIAMSAFLGSQAACTTEKPVNERPGPGDVREPAPPQPRPPVTEPDRKPDTPPVEIRNNPPGVSVDGHYKLTPRDPAKTPRPPSN